MSRKRQVKTVAAALGRADRPVGDAAPTGYRPPSALARARSQAMADSLVNMVSGIGTTMDKRSFNRYCLPIPLTQTQLDSMFMSSWLASKIVTVVADDMTREWVDLSWDGHDKDQKDARILKDAEAKWNLPGKFNEAIMWTRLYGGAALIPSFAGDDDMSKPLDVSKIRKGSLQQIHVLDRWRIQPTGEIDYDRKSAFFGLPKFYTLADAADSVPQVHCSRVLRFAGRKLPYFLWRANGMWDGSVLDPCRDAIMDYDAAMAQASALLAEKKVDVMKSASLTDSLSTSGGTALVQARYQAAAQMKGILGMVVIDKELEEWEQKVIELSGVKDILDKRMLDASGAADIPITRLFGQSPAGLTATGESDTRNYYDHVAAKQPEMLVRPLRVVYEWICRSEIGRFPENFEIEPRPLWQVSAVEKSTIEKTNSDRDLGYLKEGVITEGLIARQLKADNVYPTMEDKDVRLAEQAALEPDPVPVVMSPAVPGAKPAPGIGPAAKKPAAKPAAAEPEPPVAK